MATANESRIMMATTSELPLDVRGVVEAACETTGARDVYFILARHPKLLAQCVRYNAGLLDDGVLDGRQRELSILRVAWLCQSDYVWGHHVRIGKLNGVRTPDLSRIPEGPEHPDWSAEEATILTAVDELVHRRCISPDTWRLLARGWDEKKLLEFLVLVGHYVMISGFLNSIEIARESGVEGLPVPAGKSAEERNEAG
jgi:4-carboxymuconolactone decarboxylase